jgi:hypothetical protein
LEYETRLGSSTPPSSELPSIRFAHGSDFTWIIFEGRKYDFTKGLQAECIKHLWNEWKRGGRRNGCGLSEKTLGETGYRGRWSWSLPEDRQLSEEDRQANSVGDL